MASTRQRNGRYTGLYRDRSGKQRSAGTFTTEKEALKAARGEEALAARPTPVQAPSTKRGRITVSGYFPKWLEGHRLKPTSRASYEAHGVRIVRELGHKTLAELEPADIRAFIRRLEKIRASATVCNCMTVLREMIRTAMDDGLMERDPTAGIKLAHRKQRKLNIATPAQSRAIIAAINERYRLLAETLFATGMRYGEAMGLQACDINPAGVIRIRRTIVQVHGKPIVQEEGKTGNATRDITVDPELAGRLIEAGKGHDGGWCFRAAQGGYLYLSWFTKMFRKACEEAGAPRLRVHDIRHSHISWLANDPSVPLAAVRDRAGHSSLAVTSRYVHVMGQDEDPCLKALSVALRAA